MTTQEIMNAINSAKEQKRNLSQMSDDTLAGEIARMSQAIDDATELFKNFKIELLKRHDDTPKRISFEIVEGLWAKKVNICPATQTTKTDTNALNEAMKAAGINKADYQYKEDKAAYIEVR